MMKGLKKQIAAALSAAVMMTSCGNGFTPPAAQTPIQPVGDLYIENHYEGVEATKEETLQEFRSEDGLCVIEKKKSYYDVILDLEKGGHRSAGRAYAQGVKAICPDYPILMEPYLYENIKNVFSELEGDYSGVKKRVDTLAASLDKDHLDELEGFAQEIGEGSGYVEDGMLSCDEAMLASLVGDALRPCACSAVSMNGSRTVSGERLNSRILEWDLGADRELCTAQCVLHLKNGEKSLTSVTLLGVLSVLTAVNDDGVMGSVFDVGSSENNEYVCEGRTSYTFDLRKCLEEYSTASEAGEYLVSRSPLYTFCVNIMLTDRSEALCAELICTDGTDGHSLLRDGSTKLVSGLEWGDPEVLCIVNSFAADGNFDGITAYENNIVRWKKYDKLFCTGEKLTKDRFKELITCEKQNVDIVNFRSASAVQLVIADYADDSLQAVFMGVDGGKDCPEFIDIGNW